MIVFITLLLSLIPVGNSYSSYEDSGIKMIENLYPNYLLADSISYDDIKAVLDERCTDNMKNYLLEQNEADTPLYNWTALLDKVSSDYPYNQKYRFEGVSLLENGWYCVEFQSLLGKGIKHCIYLKLIETDGKIKIDRISYSDKN